ncbi:MAG: rhomboid family intramembrane serine protease [Thermoflexibacter sp.]|nr:rhomboid family intramembrane serine protease [Thermoflexibacter sp.]
MQLQYNSPVVLTYTFICAIILTISAFMPPVMSLFTVYPTMSLTNPIDYFRLFSHAIGHGDWTHLLSNFTLILLLGPMLEEKYGSNNLLTMMFLTALITGILNVVFFSSGLLGASGIVFMMILLSSMTNLRQGKIPLTFVLVVFLFLGKEVLSIFQNNNISEFAHIVGGICGAILESV